MSPKPSFFVLLGLFLLIATIHATYAQGPVTSVSSTLTGTVYGCSAGSCNPLGGVSVALDGCTPGVLGCRSSTTGPNGTFSLEGLGAGGNVIVFSLNGYTTVQQSVSCEQGGPCTPSSVSVAMQRNQTDFTLSTVQLTVIGVSLLGIGALIGFGASLVVKRRNPTSSTKV